jgi:hypothetical protein
MPHALAQTTWQASMGSESQSSDILIGMKKEKLTRSMQRQNASGALSLVNEKSHFSSTSKTTLVMKTTELFGSA